MTKNPLLVRFTIIFVILSLTISGCWNRKELDTLAIVVGFAIDQPDESEQVQITAQILRPSLLGVAGGGSAGGGDKPYWNITLSTNEVFNGIREFTHESNRKLYFGHNQIYLLSEDAAKKGLRNYLDLFFRDPETRRTTWVSVVKGKASEVLDTKAELEEVPSINLSQLMDTQGATSKTVTVNMIDLMTRLMSKTTSPITSVIEVIGEGKDKKAILSGTAVFRQDRLTGYLNKTETRGLLWVLNKVKSGIIMVKSPDGKSEVCLEILRASSKVTPSIKDDKLHILVKIKEEGNLGSQISSEDLTELATWKALEKSQALAIHAEIMAAVQKAQEYQLDIFGFGDAVHRKYPKLWKEIEGQWEEYFTELDVTVDVEAKLRRSGMITKPPVPE